MEIHAQNQTIEVERQVGEGDAQIQMRAEALVSGAGRDPVEVMMSDACIRVQQMEVDTDRLTLSGTVQCQAVYRLGEEGTLRGMTAQANWEHAFEIEGAAPKMYAQSCAVVEDVEARYENGHMVFTVTADLHARVMTLSPTEVITALQTEAGTETQNQSIRSVKLSAETSMTALLSDATTLPAQMDARMSIMDWSTAQVESVTPDLGGVRVTGTVQVEALISSGIANRPAALVKYPLPFNQLVELPEWLTEDARATATVSRLTTEVEQSGNGEDAALRLEAELELHIRAIGRDEAHVLSDAYSTGDMELNVETRQLPLCTGLYTTYHTEAFRGTLILPEDAPAAGSVVALRLRPVVSGFVPEDNATTVEGVMDAQVIYMVSGSDQLAAARADLSFTARVDTALSDDAWVHVQTIGVEGNALMNDRIDLKCALLVGVDARMVETIQIATNVTVAGPAKHPRGIMMYWPTESDTPWRIGKHYGVALERITAAQGNRTSMQPGEALVIRL